MQHVHGIAADHKQDAVDVGTFAIRQLANLFVEVFALWGEAAPSGKVGERGNRVEEAVVPTSGGLWRSPGMVLVVLIGLRFGDGRNLSP